MLDKIKSNIPNTITCLSLVCGCILIGVAAVCDFLDGAAARALHAYSTLGKELDSLSDLVSFGVAPGMLVFNTMSLYGEAAWPAFTAHRRPPDHVISRTAHSGQCHILDRRLRRHKQLRLSRRHHYVGRSHSHVIAHGAHRPQDVLAEIQELQPSGKPSPLHYHHGGHSLCGILRSARTRMDHNSVFAHVVGAVQDTSLTIGPRHNNLPKISLS